jgi:hypothetical protein
LSAARAILARAAVMRAAFDSDFIGNLLNGSFIRK